VIVESDYFLNKLVEFIIQCSLTKNQSTDGDAPRCYNLLTTLQVMYRKHKPCCTKQSPWKELLKKRKQWRRKEAPWKVAWKEVEMVVMVKESLEGG